MIQPGAIYYLILYGIIILVQFSKTFTLVKDQPDRYNWRDYFYVSLQIVYTSAGVAILLLLQLSREWMAVIMIAYVALVFISSILDHIGMRFRNNTRVFLHLIIIAFVAFTTIFSYERFLPKSASKEDQQQKTVAMVHHYKVALPYVDLTLSRHLGPGKMLNTQLYFSTNVEGVSRDEAVLKAKEKALSNEHGSIRPFNPSKKGNQIDVRVLNEQAVVEEVAMAPSGGS
jgi:hypothetical protein